MNKTKETHKKQKKHTKNKRNTQKTKETHKKQKKHTKNKKPKRIIGGDDFKCTFDITTIERDNDESAILGEGAYGKVMVYKTVETITGPDGDVKKLIEDVNKRKYVVKIQKCPSNSKGYKIAIGESYILHKLLTPTPHKNILKYIGCTYNITTLNFYIITEYNPEYFSLRSFIENTLPKTPEFTPTIQSTELYIADMKTLFQEQESIEHKIASTLIQGIITESVHKIHDTNIVNICIAQLYEGLFEIHKRGVFHRDIKPDNIIIDRTTGNIKYIDFGNSCDLSQWENTTNSTCIDNYHLGTINYKPPTDMLNQIRKTYIPNDNSSKSMIFIYLDYYALSIVIQKLIITREITMGYLDRDYLDNIVIFKLTSIDNRLNPLNIPYYIPVIDVLLDNKIDTFYKFNNIYKSLKSNI